MTLEDTIKQYRDWAEEWECLANLVKEDEGAGHKCQFSEGSEAYFKDAKQARQIAYWLEELKLFKERWNRGEISYNPFYSLHKACNQLAETLSNINWEEFNQMIEKAREENDGT